MDTFSEDIIKICEGNDEVAFRNWLNNYYRRSTTNETSSDEDTDDDGSDDNEELSPLLLNTPLTPFGACLLTRNAPFLQLLIEEYEIINQNDSHLVLSDSVSLIGSAVRLRCPALVKVLFPVTDLITREEIFTDVLCQGWFDMIHMIYEVMPNSWDMKNFVDRCICYYFIEHCHPDALLPVLEWLLDVSMVYTPTQLCILYQDAIAKDYIDACFLLLRYTGIPVQCVTNYRDPFWTYTHSLDMAERFIIPCLLPVWYPDCLLEDAYLFLNQLYPYKIRNSVGSSAVLHIFFHYFIAQNPLFLTAGIPTSDREYERPSNTTQTILDYIINQGFFELLPLSLYYLRQQSLPADFPLPLDAFPLTYTPREYANREEHMLRTYGFVHSKAETIQKREKAEAMKAQSNSSWYTWIFRSPATDTSTATSRRTCEQNDSFWSIFGVRNADYDEGDEFVDRQEARAIQDASEKAIIQHYTHFFGEDKVYDEYLEYEEVSTTPSVSSSVSIPNKSNKYVTDSMQYYKQQKAIFPRIKLDPASGSSNNYKLCKYPRRYADDRMIIARVNHCLPLQLLLEIHRHKEGNDNEVTVNIQNLWSQIVDIASQPTVSELRIDSVLDPVFDYALQTDTTYRTGWQWYSFTTYESNRDTSSSLPSQTASSKHQSRPKDRRQVWLLRFIHYTILSFCIRNHCKIELYVFFYQEYHHLCSLWFPDIVQQSAVNNSEIDEDEDEDDCRKRYPKSMLDIWKLDMSLAVRMQATNTVHFLCAQYLGSSGQIRSSVPCITAFPLSSVWLDPETWVRWFVHSFSAANAVVVDDLLAIFRLPSPYSTVTMAVHTLTFRHTENLLRSCLASTRSECMHTTNAVSLRQQLFEKVAVFALPILLEQHCHTDQRPLSTLLSNYLLEDYECDEDPYIMIEALHTQHALFRYSKASSTGLETSGGVVSGVDVAEIESLRQNKHISKYIMQMLTVWSCIWYSLSLSPCYSLSVRYKHIDSSLEMLWKEISTPSEKAMWLYALLDFERLKWTLGTIYEEVIRPWATSKVLVCS